MTLAELRPAAIDQRDPMVPRRCRVRAVHRETADTVTLALEPIAADRRSWVPFEAGQFHMVYAFGFGEVPISMSSDPLSPVYLHTIRSVGAVTRALCSAEVGDVVGVRGPYGRGWGVETLAGRDVVLVAGGIGLAPLRPVVYRLLAERHRYGRCILLLGARSPSDVPFASELATWERDGLVVDVSVDYAEPGWRGHVGVVTSLIPQAPMRPDRTTALVCGPEVMMRYAAKALLVRGVGAADVRLSLERNMKCGIGRCGHCQLGPAFVCKDGPVVTWPEVAARLDTWER